MQNPPDGYTVAYLDFVRLCRVSEWIKDVNPNLDVRKDGVYIKVPPIDPDDPEYVWLSQEEYAALSEHPTGDPREPALRFPCTLVQLQGFLDQQGLHGCIDPFDMADWVMDKAKGTSQPADRMQARAPQPTPTQEQKSDITVADGVAVRLPHMTKALRVAFSVMWENWRAPDPKRLPKQVNIAREIDEAMGWSPDKDGNPSRNAKAIASILKPDDPPDE